MIRVILSVVFAATTLAAGAMTVWSAQEGDESKWLFGLIAVLFAMLGVALLAGSRRKPDHEPRRPTRFVPHWFMLMAIVMIALFVVAVVVGAFLRR